MQTKSVRSEQKVQPTCDPSALALAEPNKMKLCHGLAREPRDSDYHSNRYSVAVCLPLASTQISINVFVFSTCTLSGFIKFYFQFWFALLVATHCNRALIFGFSVLHGIGLHFPVYLYDFLFVSIQILIYFLFNSRLVPFSLLVDCYGISRIVLHEEYTLFT